MISSQPYQTIKCPIQLGVKDAKMRVAIEKRVLFESKMMHRGSHLVLLTAVHCYNADLPFPEIKVRNFASLFIKHCFNPYPTKKHNQWETTLVPHEVMDVVHDVHQLHWPSILTKDGNQIIGYARHYTLQANQYATNLMNHITMNIWRYIQYTIISFCRLHHYPTSKQNPFVKELMQAIKNPTHLFTITEVWHSTSNRMILVDEVLRDDFISYHQEYLRTKSIDLMGDEESGVTIEEQAQKLVLYFVHLLRYQNGLENNEEVNAKLFYPVPLHGIKRFHMDIDGEILYYLLKDCELSLPKRSEVDGTFMKAPIFVRDGLHVNFFNEYFAVKEFEMEHSKSFNYSNGISTDNVTLSILLVKNENIEAGVAQRRKKQYRHLSGGPTNKSNYKVVDPGTVVLMLVAEYQHNGTLVSSGSLLYQHEYYHRCGITAAKKVYQEWNTPLQEVHAAMSKDHCLHSHWDRLLHGIQVMLTHRDLLQRHMFSKKWAKKKFEIYQKKQSVMATTVNSLQDPTKPDLTVLYGDDGSFPSGGRGRQSVPVKEIKNAVMRQYEVVEVDEFRTSSVCPTCGDQLFKVLEFFNGKYYLLCFD